MMTVHAPVTMSKEAFFAWVEGREERYELAGGRVEMMVRITRNHSRVVKNLIVALERRLDPEQFDIDFESFAVHVGNSVRFPDLVVGPAQEDGKALEAKAPLLIAEVLSPGTLHIDFGDKKREYLGLPTLQAYLILSADEPRVWLWQRADGAFPPEPEIVESAEGKVTLTALDITLPLGELFRGVR